MRTCACAVYFGFFGLGCFDGCFIAVFVVVVVITDLFGAE
jgi:hypothetical protein